MIFKSEIDKVYENDFGSYIMAKRFYYSESIETVKIGITKTSRYFVEANIVDYGQFYNSKVIVSKDCRVVSFNCTCGKCGRIPCHHVGALLFYLEENDFDQVPCFINLEQIRKEKELQQLRIIQRENTHRLIESYQNNIEDTLINTSTNIQVYTTVLIDEDDILLEFKVGSDKYYVIKNIMSFLKHVSVGSYFSYGKQLSFLHSKENFNELSQKVIDYMLISTSQMIQYYNTKPLRQITIKKELLDDFYNLYALMPESYINIQFKEANFKQLKVSLSKCNEFYKLTLQLDCNYLFSGVKYWYYYNQGVLYRLDQDLSKVCFSVLEQFKDEHEILIDEEDLAVFVEVVYSQIRPYIDMDESLILPYLHQQKLIKVYIDVNELGDVVNDFYEIVDHQELPFSLNQSQEFKVVKINDILKQFDAIISQSNQAIIQDQQDCCYQYTQKAIPILKRYCDVFVSNAIHSIGKPYQVKLKLGVRVENDLLALSVKDINIPRDELFDVLKFYKRKRKFYRLKNGDLVNIENSNLDQISHFVEEFQVDQHQFTKGEIVLDRYRAFLLEQNNQSDIVIDQSQSFKDMINHIQNISLTHYPLPHGYSDILRDYQIQGYQWLKTMSDYGFGGILADDMGLGKTLQVITLFESVKGKSTNIVICPASLILNWQDEIAKFSSSLKIMTIQGNKSQRQKLIKTLSDYDVIITSYDFMRNDYEMYESTVFNYIILDEAQYIKNHLTKNAFSIKQLKGQHRFALTGTPIENSLAELWSIFDFLMPNYLYQYSYFKKYYETAIVKNKDQQQQQRLKQMVEPFILRRTKKDVLTELPDKIETVHSIQFSKEEQKLYLANLVQINKELQQKFEIDHTVSKIAILSMMTRLRQLCCDARLVYDNVQQPSSKLKACIDLIQIAQENHEKVLLFSSFTSSLYLIQQQLEQLQISYYILTGDTSKNQRHQLVKQFQEDQTTVFLISLKAGGTGLNLTSAQTVIHFDPWWNISAQNQATDRAYRMGQTKNVMVHKLVMKDSIEEKILHLQEKKMNLADAFVENNQGSITTMTKDEIMNLFEL